MNSENKNSELKRARNKNNLVKNWYEEFKLNRQGKTKHKRIDVMSKYRRIDRFLNRLILVLVLLVLITWTIILFY